MLCVCIRKTKCKQHSCANLCNLISCSNCWKSILWTRILTRTEKGAELQLTIKLLEIPASLAFMYSRGGNTCAPRWIISHVWNMDHTDCLTNSDKFNPCKVKQPVGHVATASRALPLLTEKVAAHVMWASDWGVTKSNQWSRKETAVFSPSSSRENALEKETEQLKGKDSCRQPWGCSRKSIKHVLLCALEENYCCTNGTFVENKLINICQCALEPGI